MPANYNFTIRVSRSFYNTINYDLEKKSRII